MKTIKMTVHHGTTNETATATGATIHEAIYALKAQQRLGGYVIDNTRPAFIAFVSTLETSGRAQHGWADYEIVKEDAPDHTNPLKYEPLFSRLTWGNGTCAEFIGDKDTADELGAEVVARWNNQEPDIHTRKAWAAIERQNAEIKALRDALAAAVQYLEKHRPKGNIRDIFSELNEYENGVMKPARAALEGGER